MLLPGSVQAKMMGVVQLMAIFWLLAATGLALAIAALVKYLSMK